MAEEQHQDRTEQATPKRREEARKKGDVPRSRELTMTGVMLSGGSAVLLLAQAMGEKLTEAFRGGFKIERELIFDDNYPPIALAEIGSQAFSSLIPLAVILIGAVFLSAVAIGGWSFSLQAVGFKAERLSPVKGIKRIFSANGLNELIKALAKFALVALVAVSWLWWSVEDLISLAGSPSQAQSVMRWRSAPPRCSSSAAVSY